MDSTATGIIEGLKVEPIAASVSGLQQANYTLRLGRTEVELNGHLGKPFRLTLLDQRICQYCKVAIPIDQRGTHNSYCETCVRTLARCDFCMLSPERCHFAQGTCREPKWGEQVCMQPHTVYLAHTSGPKVGITRAGGELQRWLNQGAVAALPLAQTQSRYLAGLLEARVRALVSDRTQWRRLVQGPARPVDLKALAASLRDRVALPGTAAEVTWIDPASGGEPLQIAYPISQYAPAQQLRLSSDSSQLIQPLLGIKGQYLLMRDGVFNVAAHRGMLVEWAWVHAGQIEQVSVAQPDLF